MSQDGDDYASQELELDAFAFTEYYLETFEGIKEISEIPNYEQFIFRYIEMCKSIM